MRSPDEGCDLNLTIRLVLVAKVSHLEMCDTVNLMLLPTYIHDAAIVNSYSRRVIKEQHSTTSVQSMVDE